MTISKWCGFASLRQGGYACGVYTIITRLGAFILWSVCASQAASAKGFFGRLFLNVKQTEIQAILVWLSVHSVILIILGVVLLYGTWKSKRYFLLPWIIWMFVDLISNSVILVFCGIALASKLSTAGTTVGLLSVIVIYAFHIYCILCIVSLYDVFVTDEIRSYFTNRQSSRLPSISESVDRLIENMEPPAYTESFAARADEIVLNVGRDSLA